MFMDMDSPRSEHRFFWILENTLKFHYFANIDWLKDWKALMFLKMLEMMRYEVYKHI